VSSSIISSRKKGEFLIGTFFGIPSGALFGGGVPHFSIYSGLICTKGGGGVLFSELGTSIGGQTPEGSLWYSQRGGGENSSKILLRGINSLAITPGGRLLRRRGWSGRDRCEEKRGGERRFWKGRGGVCFFRNSNMTR